jgi:hypothetical protein
MNAGRELDAEVAERVMGFRRVVAMLWSHTEEAGADVPILVPPWEPGEWNFVNRRIDELHFVPHYNTKIADAWQVIERMEYRGYQWQMECWDDGRYACRFYRVQPASDAEGWKAGRDVPRVICRAALAAIDTDIAQISVPKFTPPV